MVKNSNMKEKGLKVPEQYQELVRDINELFEAVRTGNPFRYRRQFEGFRDKYFDKAGQDPNVDFNLTVSHLKFNPEFSLVHAGMNIDTDKICAYTANTELIHLLKDSASIRESFNYLDAVAEHYKRQLISERGDIVSRCIHDYLISSVELPANMAKRRLKGYPEPYETIENKIRGKRFVRLWEKLWQK